MKPPILFALALGLSSGVLGQDRPRENQHVQQDVTPEKLSIVPDAIDFQGRLQDALGSPVNGTLSIAFKFFNVEAGGTPVWSETQSAVEVIDGLFQVRLGSMNPIHPDLFIDGETLWLAIQIDGEAEMSPRIHFASTGYAMKTFERDPTWIGNANPEDPISRPGNVGIGLSDPPAKLSVGGLGSDPAIPGITSTGLLSIRPGANEAIDFGKMGSNPYTGWIQAGFNLNVPDPLSLNPLGGYVGIGTNTPTQLLDVSGTFRLRGHLFDYNNTSGTNGQVLTRGANGVLWQTPATSPWLSNGSNIYFDAGNVGIGGQNISSIARLQVKTTGSEVLALESSALSYWLAFYTSGVRKGILWMSDNTLNVRSDEGGVAIKTSGNNTRLTIEDDGDITTPLTGANKNIVPVAFGYVNQLGQLNTAKSTSNVTATVTGSAGSYNYIVTITGVTANSFIALVTPGGDYISFPRLMYEGNTFTVNFMSHTGATGQANNFSFVVFSP